MTLEELFDDAAKFAHQNFIQDGEIMPMWMGADADSHLALIVTPFDSEESKDICVAMVKQKFKEKGVIRYAFISEAWVVTAKSRDEISTMEQPSKHPDRREVITIIAEEKGRSLQGTYYILRPEHGKPTLSPFEKYDSNSAEGRMTGILD